MGTSSSSDTAASTLGPMTPRYDRVCVTGASGFIGRLVADHYRAEGADVTGVDVTADPGRGVVAGDISVPGPWRETVAAADLVVHTAAVVSMAVPLRRTWEINVRGTANVLDAARPDARFLHVSSIVVLPDEHPEGGLDETTPVLVGTGVPYRDTKVAAELMVLMAHAAGRRRVTVVRPGDVYGPRSRPWTIIPVETIRSGLFALPAGGRGDFNPVYCDDLVAGIVAAAESGDAAGEVFHLAGERTVDTAEFFGHYARMLGMRAPMGLPTRLVGGGASLIAAIGRLRGKATETNPDTIAYLARTAGVSSAKAGDVLGWRPRVSLEEGMRRTEEWLRAEGML